MPLVGGWVVPHAPLLVPGLSRRGAEARRPRLGRLPGDVTVVVSPHGRRTAVHAEPAGSLAGFGVGSIERAAPGAPVRARAVAEGWGFPLVDEPLDHGALVPLWWLDGAAPVVACSFAEITGPEPRGSAEEVAAAARLLAGAVEALARDVGVALVASAHLSAALAPGAPLAAVPGAAEFDRRILGALAGDPASVLDVAPDEWERVGACGLGPLITLAALFAGGSARVLHYEHPFGVGYVHALVTR